MSTGLSNAFVDKGSGFYLVNRGPGRCVWGRCHGGAQFVGWGLCPPPAWQGRPADPQAAHAACAGPFGGGAQAAMDHAEGMQRAINLRWQLSYLYRFASTPTVP